MVKNRPERPTILVFEGPDKSGKSTLIREVNKITNYKFFCIDRFTGSAWVYDKLSGRRDRAEELSQVEDELSKLKNVLMLTILLSCNQEKLKERMNSEPIYADLGAQQPEKAVKLYKEYAKSITRLPIIMVDTSDQTIETTVQEIIEKVEQYGQDNSR